eukprot:9450902-Pyramimonas_sp.AAC.1
MPALLLGRPEPAVDATGSTRSFWKEARAASPSPLPATLLSHLPPGSANQMTDSTDFGLGLLFLMAAWTLPILDAWVGAHTA